MVILAAAARAAVKLGEPAEAFCHGTVVDRGRQLQEELEDLSLGKERRVSFYPLGAAVALLLQRARPEWKSVCLEQPFEVTSLFFMEP